MPAGAPGDWFMSMVPLNFGAAAPLRLKPHFVHVDAVSEFCVPQFGQNTQHLRQHPLAISKGGPCEPTWKPPRERSPHLSKWARGYWKDGRLYKGEAPS